MLALSHLVLIPERHALRRGQMPLLTRLGGHVVCAVVDDGLELGDEATYAFRPGNGDDGLYHVTPVRLTGTERSS